MRAGERRSIAKYRQHFGGNICVMAVCFNFVRLVAPVLLLVFGLSLFAESNHNHGGLLMAATTPLNLISRLTRDQGPEQEQALNWSNLNVVSTPTSIRTDRKIKFILLQFRGRLTNGGTGPTLRTAPVLLGTQLFGLFTQIVVRGQHLRYGSQTPIVMRGETSAEMMALFMPNYVPTWSVSINGAAPTRSGALSSTLAQTNDVDMVLPIPLFPLGVSASDAPFYCFHGPDWPGNLYVDVTCGDGTCVATANAPTLTAYGSATGVPLINVMTERPLISKELMAQIRPALTFRNTSTQQPVAAVSAGGGTGVKISDLTVGKDTTRIFLKTGTQSAGGSAGTVNYASLLDSIVTRTFFSLDNRQLRFQPSNGDMALQDYAGRSYGRTMPIGYKVIDFISAADGGANPDNPKAAFQSSKLTAARKFELDGDVTAAANQIAEVVQEMVLGRPGLVSSGTSA